ncbi:MAG: CinA family protein [Rhodospirillales bacterium]
MKELLAAAERIAVRLKTRKETVAVAESSSGGLVSAALLSVGGASVYFQGGAVVYTRIAGKSLFGVQRQELAGMRSSSEPYALFMARRARDNLGATWGLCETGAAGPTGNGYGDAAGHSCFAIAGPVEKSVTLETGSADRYANMLAFGAGALALLEQALGE